MAKRRAVVTIGTLGLDRGVERAAPPPALRGAARGDPLGPAPARRAPAVDAGARGGPRSLAQHRARRVRPAPRRGLPGGARGRGDHRRVARCPRRSSGRTRRPRGAERPAGGPGCPAGARSSSARAPRSPGAPRRPVRSGPGCRGSSSSRSICGRRLVARRWRRVPRQLLDYGDPAGYAPLREAIAAYLREARAVRCEAEQVIVVTGRPAGRGSCRPRAPRSRRHGLDRGPRLPGRARRPDRGGIRLVPGPGRRGGSRRPARRPAGARRAAGLRHAVAPVPAGRDDEPPPPAGAPRVGEPRAARGSSRTTTTASTATRGARSRRSRASTRRAA